MSPLLITSHFRNLLPVQMVRVKVRRDNEEPSTQRRTKARHDPAALQAVQEALGQLQPGPFPNPYLIFKGENVKKRLQPTPYLRPGG
jgi:hypothetical protein